jgi:hypothetical protein
MDDGPDAQVSIKDFFEAVLDEQRRGMVVAEQEREKAARSLREELQRTIEDGDRALREHIGQQVQQIQAALVSAEKLELERIASLRREVNIINEASKTAIAKAEAATEKRFEGVNEWRGQSADRERTQQQAIQDAQERSMPREVAEAQFNELRRAVADLYEKVSKVV